MRSKDKINKDCINCSSFNIEELLNTGKWAYTIKDKEIYFKYLGNKDKSNLGYSLHFDWPESEQKDNQ